MFQTPPIQKLQDPLAIEHQLSLSILRLDLIHPEISGNKWFKLQYNIEEARRLGKDHLVSFGGAHSNHIAALAKAGRMFGIRTTAYIRGEAPAVLSPTLNQAQRDGMDLRFITRADYRAIRTSQIIQDELVKQHPNALIIPEGGSNPAGLLGCMEIPEQPGARDFDIYCVACGTGCTLAGLVLGLKPGQHVLGFPVLAGGNFLNEEIKRMILGPWDAVHLSNAISSDTDRIASWNLMMDYHFGGYAKVTDELLKFKAAFERQHSLSLDYVYTSKLLFGVMDLVRKGFFIKGSRMLIVHSGGLQGNIAMEERLRLSSKG